MSDWLKYGRDRRRPAASGREMVVAGSAGGGGVRRDPSVALQVLLRLEVGGGRRRDDARIDLRALRVALSECGHDLPAPSREYVERAEVLPYEPARATHSLDSVLDRIERGLRPIRTVRSAEIPERTEHERLLAMAASVRAAYGPDSMPLRTMPRRRMA